jgi:SAM-dependent methyltransferase
MSHIHPTTRCYVNERGIAGGYDRYFSDSSLFAFDSELLDEWLVVPGRVLDLGCGTGRHVCRLGARGFCVVGVDLSVHMLGIAGEKLAWSGLPRRLVRGDLLEVDHLIRPGSFDYAICMFSTLGMIAGGANRLRFVRGVRRLLRPGGLFVVHVHNLRCNFFTTEGLGAMAASAARRVLGRGEWGDKILSSYRGIRNMCIHVFSRPEVVNLLETAGLRVLEVVHLNRHRDGRLGSRFAASWRANGFIVLAQRPERGEFDAALKYARRHGKFGRGWSV